MKKLCVMTGTRAEYGIIANYVLYLAAGIELLPTR